MLLATAAFAQDSVVDSEQADKTYLTIYPDNLGLVTEVRTVTVPAGRSTIRFFGVSDQIISQSATLLEFSGVSIERNFTSDLISKANLLSKSVGKTVTITRVNRAKGTVISQRATIVSASPTTGTILDIDGQYEALECSGLGEAVSFDNMPDGVSADPILSIDVSRETAGETELMISYLTRGLSWEADYRLDALPGAEQGPLLGWLTITNRTSKNFKDVPTAIVAGELNRVQDGYNDQSAYNRSGWQSAACWPKGSTKTGVYRQVVVQEAKDSYGGVREAPSVAYSMRMESELDEVIVTGAKRMATREDLGDYKLYRTPQPVTVAPMQTKQIAFLSVPDAEFEPVFAFDYPLFEIYAFEDASVEYRINNDRDGNLGQPLPKGTVRVMTRRPNGQTAFLGENSIENSAVDLPVDVKISDSIAVTMETDFTPNTSINEAQATYSLTLSADVLNATNAEVISEIEITQAIIRANHISEQSHTPDPEKAVPTYAVPVPAQGSTNWSVTLPVEPVYAFEFADIQFAKNSAGETDKLTADLQYRLKDDGRKFWPTQYFKAGSGADVLLKSTLVSYSERIAANGVMSQNAQLRHVFSNDTQADIVLTFVLPEQESGYFTISEATISPDADTPFLWTIAIAAGETVSLSYMIEAEDLSL